MSHIGQQFLAPNGWKSLLRGRRYHYLGEVAPGHWVRFVWFSEKPRAAHLDQLKLCDFQEGLNCGLIKLAVKQATLPPWLQSYERDGVDLSNLEEMFTPSRRTRRVRSPEQEVDARLRAIFPLIDEMEQLLRAPDMERRINRFARQSAPELNECRTRLQFLVYVAFGRNRWALLPGRTECGRKRVEVAGPGDFGRDSPLRGRYARPQISSEMREKIVECWKRFSTSPDRKLKVVITRIISEGFGGRQRTIGDRSEFYHPEGEPLPSTHQVLYTLRVRVGKEEMQRVLYGAARVRNRCKASRGSYSQHVANLLERVEGDAYFVDEVPSGPNDGNPMPPLAVVRIRCTCSGMLVGIGFSIGGESEEAYMMALFSMALPKKQFCKLFGLEIEEADWPCQGLPAWVTFDRGPGGRIKLAEEFEKQVSIRTLPPTYSGQSKAVVESSHPRARADDGAPTYVMSNHTYVQLAKREIRRLIADNQRMNVSSRLTPNMLRQRVFCSPLAVWNYLDGRCRTSAFPMALDSAINTFLRPVRFTIDGDGAHLCGQLYRSEALLETGICDQAEVGGVIEVEGYAPGICLRGAWLKIRNRFVWVDMCMLIADDQDQLYLSLPELEQLARIRKDLRALAYENDLAVTAEARRRFKEETGHRWDDGLVRRGHTKRKTRSAQAEYGFVKKVLRA